MDEINLICLGLKATLPSIDLAGLLTLDDPRAVFEEHATAETGPDYWVYSVNGKTLDGELMVVRATLPIQAETLAQEGLRDTIAALTRLRDETGVQSTVEMRGVH